MVLYALTIFLGSFLLFQIQPIIGRMILPAFGGGAGVWTACLLFFQAVLLGGYGYAHLLSRLQGGRRQTAVHLVLIVMSLCFLPITPGLAAHLDAIESPTRDILLVLLVAIGGPYLVLSSTAPLLQYWLTGTHPGRSPYRLYALSNAASLLALLSYPFLVESTLTLSMQGVIWTQVYAVYAALCGWCAWRFGRTCLPGPINGSTIDAAVMEGTRPSSDENGGRLRVGFVLLWLGLSLAGSVMLLATTNQMCMELSVVPFLWVVPLSVYLLSFIICFDHERWYQRWCFVPLLIGSVVAATVILYGRATITLWIQLPIYVVTLFACCMTCHGELVRLKPPAQKLTVFYLVVATGGALGGVTVALFVPLVFSGYWEYHAGLVLSCLLVMICVCRNRGPQVTHRRSALMWIAAALIVGGIGAALVSNTRATSGLAVVASRNFYGVLRIFKVDYGFAIFDIMLHGETIHGSQFADLDRRSWPTAYYGRDSGIGIAMAHYVPDAAGERQALRIGVVGLGTGAISTYGRSGDYVRFYEINPEVARLAMEHFSYMADSLARVEIVLGDARIALEQEAAAGERQAFDVLAIDAFNSDAIPIHLLTREAFEVYWMHLKPHGILALNISNRFVDLTPVVHDLAVTGGYEAKLVLSPAVKSLGTEDATWALVTRNTTFLTDPAVQIALIDWPRDDSTPRLWTDNHASLWSVLGRMELAREWSMPLVEKRFIIDEADLITGPDKKRIEAACRRLYEDSDGVHPIIVLTVNAMAERGLSDMPFRSFVEGMFRRAGMVFSQMDRAVMVLISAGDRKATIQLGRGWPRDQEAFERILNDVIIARLGSKDASCGIAAAVEALDRLIRETGEGYE